MVGDAGKIAQIAKVAEDTYISPGYFAHGVTWEWCRRGLLPPQVDRLKALYAPRLDACLAALAKYLPDAATTKPEGGFFLSVTLPEGLTTSAVREAAVAQELQLADGEAFFPDGGGQRFLRLPYCALTPDEIDEGVRRLAAAVKSLR
jgi:DNA-binding transcriptional MocR family regulator